MLNISTNTVSPYVTTGRYQALKEVEERKSGKVLLRLLLFFTVLFVVLLFLPWTQNIRANGTVTTLQPNQRPQDVQTIIGGRIEEWFVREGDFVEAGDTLLHVSETKDEYFDDNLLGRAATQVAAKEMSVRSYASKAGALEDQMSALRQSATLKLEQARNKLEQAQLKVQSDSIDVLAAQAAAKAAEDQYLRNDSLYEKGLKSLTAVQDYEVKYQETRAKVISAQNKLLASRNDVLNARVEIEAIQAKLRDDLAKARSDRYSALSNQLAAEADVAKLENQYSNYERRTSLYFITAPQAGYVTQILSEGIGENLKAGETVLTIVPADYQLAVEMYVRPLDLPLLEAGQEVNIQFDGWPAIVFSGWPNTSYGTYRGQVFAIDRDISEQGLYRIMIAPDPNDEPWPDPLRVGAGATGLILLKDVPIWYELWRQLNGFPPDLYTKEKKDTGPKPPKIKVK